MATIRQPTKIGAVLERARERRGYSMEEAAQRAGFSTHERWRRICYGTKRPRTETLVACALAVGCTPKNFARERPDAAVALQNALLQKVVDDVKVSRERPLDVLDQFVDLAKVFEPDVLRAVLETAIAITRPRPPTRHHTTPSPRKVNP